MRPRGCPEHQGRGGEPDRRHELARFLKTPSPNLRPSVTWQAARRSEPRARARSDRETAASPGGAGEQAHGAARWVPGGRTRGVCLSPRASGGARGGVLPSLLNHKYPDSPQDVPPPHPAPWVFVPSPHPA